ncbi:MAG TPA: methyltransferase domain-containing protein [Bryobacteraceae bacterium]|jgi:pimeloyl-ACP methyl ester carboxylesterase|nr:methyltransferase domain-containing protein [Bryobacteraceae bacterium]
MELYMPLRAVALGFAISAILFAQNGGQFTDIPFVPTASNVVDTMLDVANIKPGDVLIDLGSGDGRIVMAACKRFGIQATGVEIDPDLVRQSQTLANQDGLGGKANFVQADLFTYDLRPATVVTMFLTPGVNLRLRSKLLAELRPGTRIVSHRFDMGSWLPTKTIKLEDDRVYLWVVPASGVESTNALSGPAASYASSPRAPSQENPASMFSYDAAAPLNTRLEKPEIADKSLVTTVSFSGSRGPVSATLVTPSRRGKYPAIIFVPDYGRRDEFLPEALLLARARRPAVSLLIDGPQERPVGWRRSFNSLSDNDNDRDIHIQAIIDIRRGIDMLSQRDEVDPSRIAYVGHGYGANWGAILSSVEPRLRAFVLVAGFTSLAELMESDDPDMANMRFSMGPERFARYRDSMSAVDPIRFTSSWAGAPILFQFGRFDQFVPRAAAEGLASSISRPQKVIFYDAGHSVNAPQAMVDRSGFLARYINSEQLRSLGSQ